MVGGIPSTPSFSRPSSEVSSPKEASFLPTLGEINIGPSKILPPFSQGVDTILKEANLEELEQLTQLRQEIAPVDFLPKQEEERLALLHFAKEQVKQLKEQNISYETEFEGKIIHFFQETETENETIYQVIVVEEEEQTYAFRLHYHKEVTDWDEQAANTLQVLEEKYKRTHLLLTDEKQKQKLQEKYLLAQTLLQRPKKGLFSTIGMARANTLKEFEAFTRTLLKEKEAASLPEISRPLYTLIDTENGTWISHLTPSRPSFYAQLNEKGAVQLLIKRPFLFSLSHPTKEQAVEQMYTFIEEQVLLWEEQFPEEAKKARSSETPLFLPLPFLHLSLGSNAKEEGKALRYASALFHNTRLEVQDYLICPQITFHSERIDPSFSVKEKLSFKERIKPNALSNARALLLLHEKVCRAVQKKGINSESLEAQLHNYPLAEEKIFNSLGEYQKVAQSLYAIKKRIKEADALPSEEDLFTVAICIEKLLLDGLLDTKDTRFEELWEGEYGNRFAQNFHEYFNTLTAVQKLEEPFQEDLLEKLFRQAMPYVLIKSIERGNLSLVETVILSQEEFDYWRNGKGKIGEKAKSDREEFEKLIQQSINSYIQQVENTSEEAASDRVFLIADLLANTQKPLLTVSSKRNVLEFCLQKVEEKIEENLDKLEAAAKPIAEHLLAHIPTLPEEAPKLLQAYKHLLQTIVSNNEEPEKGKRVALAFASVYQQLEAPAILLSSQAENPFSLFFSSQKTATIVI